VTADRANTGDTDETALRQAVVSACHAMVSLGLTQGTAGNISVRHAGGMLITPTATPYDRLGPDDLPHVTLDAADGAWSGKLAPSSEWRFHRDILRARPEFAAVVHAHPTFCTALAMQRRGIPPCHYMVAVFGGEDVRCGGYATFGTQALSDQVLAALADRSACLLANHGMIACGRDLDQAMAHAVELEALARQYVTSLAAGGPVLLSAREMADAIVRFRTYRP
jgi:L-fuculose-phosphate aldolase